MKEIDQHPAYSACLEAFLQNIGDRRLSDYTLPPEVGRLVLAYQEAYGGETQQFDSRTLQRQLRCPLAGCDRDRHTTEESDGIYTQVSTQDTNSLGDPIMPPCFRGHPNVVLEEPTFVADVIQMPKRPDDDDPTPPPIAA